MKKLIFTAAIAVGLTACHTFHIKNGPNASTNYQQKDWHHIGILSLVEFSEPVNLAEKCEGKSWESVRTRTGPLQVLVGLIPYVSYVYSPEEVSITCSAKN